MGYHLVRFWSKKYPIYKYTNGNIQVVSADNAVDIQLTIIWNFQKKRANKICITLNSSFFLSLFKNELFRNKIGTIETARADWLVFIEYDELKKKYSIHCVEATYIHNKKFVLAIESLMHNLPCLNRNLNTCCHYRQPSIKKNSLLEDKNTLIRFLIKKLFF